MPRRVLYCEVCEDGTVGGSHQILFDLVRGLDPDRYVAHVVFYQENRFAQALRDQGHEVTVWEALRPRERRPFPDGPRPAKLVASLVAIWRRRRLLRRNAIDLVHLNNSPHIGYDDWLPAARLCGAACVTNAVGAPYTPPESAWARRLATGWDRIIAISDHIASSLAAGGFPEERLRTVTSGIDVADFRARATRDPAELRRELGVEPEAVLVAMVGNLRPWKGQGQVAKALAELAPSVRQRLRVVFAGAARTEDADYVAGLGRALAEAGFGERARILGPRLDIPDLLRACDVAVHASTFPEPFGLVVIEPLVFGKPVVAARRGGPVEILREGTGFLHDPDRPEELAAHLTRLVEEPALRAAIAPAARARAEDLDARRAAARIQDLYDEVLRERGGEAPAAASQSD